MGSSYSSCDKRKVYPEKFDNENYRPLNKNEIVRSTRFTRSSSIIIEEKNVPIVKI